MPETPGLRRQRELAAYSQRALGEAAGVTHATICRAEAGGDVRPVTIRKLAQALRVEPRQLLEAEPEPETA